MRLCVLIFVLCLYQSQGFNCSSSCVAGSHCGQPLDYYWRDYMGTIPEDAIPGGLDEAGEITYIGQAYIKNFELLPGTIYRGCKNLRVSAYNKEIQATRNIKILCGKERQNYQWIAIKSDQMHLLTDCHLVMGGNEVEHLLTIGRAQLGGQTIVGKVFPHPLGNKGLWVPYNGKEMNFQTFEILTYACYKSELCVLA